MSPQPWIALLCLLGGALSCNGDKDAQVDTAALVDQACEIGKVDGSTLGAGLAESCENCSQLDYRCVTDIVDQVCDDVLPSGSQNNKCPSVSIRAEYKLCCMYAAYDAYTAGWITAGCPGEYDRYCFPPSP